MWSFEWFQTSTTTSSPIPALCLYLQFQPLVCVFAAIGFGVIRIIVYFIFMKRHKDQCHSIKWPPGARPSFVGLSVDERLQHHSHLTNLENKQIQVRRTLSRPDSSFAPPDALSRTRVACRAPVHVSDHSLSCHLHHHSLHLVRQCYYPIHLVMFVIVCLILHFVQRSSCLVYDGKWNPLLIYSHSLSLSLFAKL